VKLDGHSAHILPLLRLHSASRPWSLSYLLRCPLPYLDVARRRVMRVYSRERQTYAGICRHGTVWPMHITFEVRFGRLRGSARARPKQRDQLGKYVCNKPCQSVFAFPAGHDNSVELALKPIMERKKQRSWSKPGAMIHPQVLVPAHHGHGSGAERPAGATPSSVATALCCLGAPNPSGFSLSPDLRDLWFRSIIEVMRCPRARVTISAITPRVAAPTPHRNRA